MQFSEEIMKVLSLSDIAIFSKPNCVYCNDLKEFLEGVTEFVVADVEGMPKHVYEEFVETVLANTDLKAFPICFMNKQYISVSDLKKKLMLSFKDDDIDNI